jgi:hypothetical protein
MRSLALRLSAIVALLMGIGMPFPAQLHAQVFYGSIVGTVTDTTGAIVPGATITLTNKSTDEKHTATSNGAGEYTFVDLVPAIYSVQVERANFKRYVRDTVTVEVNTTTRADAQLQVGAVSETVEVNTTQVLLQTDSGTVSNKVESQQMDELPLNGRNVMQLLNITAGVIPSSAVEQGATLAQNNGTSTNPLSWGGGSSVYTINGGDNEEYLDGAPINVLQGSNIGLMPTADAIQEFNIDTSANGADEGRSTGGVINETTKSGTNVIHGTAYEYFRNADLNANNFFNKRTITAAYPNGLPTPKFNQNLYGFNLGFPVKKDKIFFFGSYEVNDSLTQAPTLSNEPTNGNAYSAGQDIYDGVFTRQIYDPRNPTNSPDAGDGCVITAGTNASGVNTWTLGTGCLDPTAQILKTYWAEQPNSLLAGSNYAVNIPAGDHAPEMNARMDFNISPKQRMFAHTAWWGPLDKPIIPYPNPNVPSALPNGKAWGLGSAVGGFNSNLYILGDTYTISPKTVLDLRAVYLRFRYSMIPKVNNFDLSGLGPNWAQFNNYLPSGEHWLPAPSMNAGNAVHNLAPTNFPNFGGFGANGQGQIWDNYGLNGTLSHVFGRNTVKAGFEARLMDMEILPSGFNAGSPSFGIKYSSPPGCAYAGGCGDEWAEFLMGYFVTTSFSGSYGGTEFNWYQAYFLQDTWQATRNLTLNLGVRWELPGGLEEKKNSTLVFQPYATDPNTLTYGTEALVASPTYPSRSIFPIKHDLIDPRVGFAYRLGNKTVVRGGFGISTQAVDEDGGGNGAPGTAVNSDQLSWTNPTGPGQVPVNTLQNPIPSLSSIYVPAPRRTPNFLQVLATAAQTAGGVQLNGFWQNERLPYFEQYNFAVQRAIGNSFQITASYVGSHGLELNTGKNVDEIPASAYSVTTNPTTGAQTAVATTGPYAGMNLTAPVPVPGTVAGKSYANGVYCTPNNAFCDTNWLVGQTLQPYSYYSNAQIGNEAYGNQHYNALQSTSQWRIPGGGLIGGAFTWAKTINDTTAQQDYTNHRADRAVAGVPMRLAINVNYPLPIGQGQMFLSGNNFASRFISGWAINDISSFQHGGYLGILTNTSNQLNQHFGAGKTRANYVPGCKKTISGSAVSRLGEWFNTACFTYPGDYTYGNESANDSQLFAQGIDNQDIALLKTTKIAERLNIQFRLETFNTFNRFQAGNPASLSVGNGNFGKVTSQANNPRQVQLSLRLNY